MIFVTSTFYVGEGPRPAHASRNAPGFTPGATPADTTVDLIGFDTFDPITMEADHLAGDHVACWLLDTDYNGLAFHRSCHERRRNEQTSVGNRV